MLKFGTVCELQEANGRARVEFEEDGITSAFLPIVFPSSTADQYRQMPAINAQVACIMDENLEDGAIIGAIYSAAATPSNFESSERGVIFGDGSKATYKNGVITIKGASKVVIEGAAKVSIKTAFDGLASILSDLMAQLQLETHLSGAPGAPTTPPVNIAAYAALQARINALLE